MRKHAVTVLCIAAIVLAFAAAPAAAETYRDIYQLGQPTTRFSDRPANSLPELKSQFVQYRDDLEAALRLGGWSGDSDALFEAVAGAEPDGPTVTARAVSKGETFHWMAYRKNGSPAIARNVRWAGSQPFAAWQIQFVSDGSVHTFIVPHLCLNLAYYGEPIPVDAPGAPKVPGVPGAAPMAAPGAAAPSPAPEAPGAAAPAAPGAPGAPGDATPMMEEEMEGAEPETTPQPMEPAAAPASSTAEPMREMVPPASREGRWTLRGWGARFAPDDEKWRGEVLGIGEASQFYLTHGTGVGFDAEYHLNRRWGVDFGLLAGLGNELHWMFDTAALWEMDTADLDVLGGFVGMNFHFMPESRFDLYAGPFLGLFQFESDDLRTAQGFEYELDPDSQFTLGAVIGADLAFSEDGPWIGTAAVRYTPMSIEDSPVDFDIDPLIFSVGIGYRF